MFTSLLHCPLLQHPVPVKLALLTSFSAPICAPKGCWLMTVKTEGQDWNWTSKVTSTPRLTGAETVETHASAGKYLVGGVFYHYMCMIVDVAHIVAAR